VRDREIGIERECAGERGLGLIETLGGAGVEILAHHMMNAAEASPSRSVVGIRLEPVLVEIARDRPLLSGRS
jgi:hypothetical protein